MGFLQDPFFSFLSSFPLPSFYLLLLTLLSAVPAVGLTVQPSNNSADIAWSEQARFRVESSQVLLPRAIELAPLSQALIDVDQNHFSNLTGSLVLVTNSISLGSSDIAFISCDKSAYPGNLHASDTVNYVLTSSKKPLAVLLYSTTDTHCNSTDDGTGNYVNIFTLLSADFASQIERQLQSGASNGSSQIVPTMSAFASPGPTGGDNSGSGGGPAESPNTAMIILYSITGIITALFLTIIITGAIRAHRHPERYGPRQRPGRPRQSRARGIARAMLETIPIVKFGDHDDGRPEADKGDIEMSMASEVPASQVSEEHPPMVTGGTMPPAETQRNPTDSTPEPNRDQQTPVAETETPAEHPNFSCPICTDDFVKGQDLRVLPCNHQFHPDCIDPWLVNVSGTCPLCRIDLNPTQAEGENEGEGGEPAAEGASNERPAEGTHRHRRISTYLHDTLNARRMRDASVEERLAALRSVRENAGRDENENREDTDEQRRRRRRLSIRLRERFRVRTRAHGDDGPREETSPPS